MLGCKQLLQCRPYRSEVFLLCCRRVASDHWKKLSQVFCRRAVSEHKMKSRSTRFTQWVPVPSFDCNQQCLTSRCSFCLILTCSPWNISYCLEASAQAKKSRLYCAYLGSSSNTLMIFQPRHSFANGMITERSGRAHASFRLPSRTSTDTSLVAQPLPGVPPELQ